MHFQPLTITARTQQTHDAITLAFAGPATFQPGQYLTLRTTIDGEDTRRSYSICSGPDEPLQIAIKRVEDGRFSAWAHATLRPGHTIDAMPPAGRFTLKPTSGPRTILAIAAGSGITPILAIAKSILAQEPESRIALLYGSRRTNDILFRTELEALKDRHMQRLSLTHILSREQQDIPLLNGRLDPAKLHTLLPSLFPGTLPDTAMICGPAALIDAMTTALEASGMPATRILSERFTTGTPPAPRPTRAPTPHVAPFATATIIADGVATEIPMQAEETILDAALRAGLDLPYACRGGMCSTCRARITEGAIGMDVNYSLEPWETAAGYVLTCQSRPKTPTITVDYDHV